jgi:hypothetical protein
MPSREAGRLDLVDTGAVPERDRTCSLNCAGVAMWALQAHGSAPWSDGTEWRCRSCDGCRYSFVQNTGPEGRSTHLNLCGS